MTKIVANRKQQILAEATRLFSQEGYDKVTIKMLAAACGITEPALYRHYRSKDEIYNSVLDHVTSQLDYQRVFDELAGCMDIEQILRSLATHIIDFFQGNDQAYRLLLYSALGGHSKARMVFRRVRGAYVRFLKEALDRLFEAGLIKSKNNEITARCFVGMVFDCSLTATLYKSFQGKEYAPPEVIANNIPIYVAGLKAPAPNAGEKKQ